MSHLTIYSIGFLSLIGLDYVHRMFRPFSCVLQPIVFSSEVSSSFQRLSINTGGNIHPIRPARNVYPPRLDHWGRITPFPPASPPRPTTMGRNGRNPDFHFIQRRRETISLPSLITLRALPSILSPTFKQHHALPGDRGIDQPGPVDHRVFYQ